MRRFEEWTIAYRARQPDRLLMEDQSESFSIIPNTWRYWCADPHLFDYNSRTYVFAELYDRILRRGVIGCCEISNSGCTPWKVVLKMPWHLSYPHVFSYDNSIYMIPESYAGSEISVFKAIEFPVKWEKVHILKADCVAVDSTLFFTDDKCLMLTLEEKEGRSCLNLYAVQNGTLSGTPCCVSEDNGNIRPAGHLFFYQEKLIRPAQDCSESYGCALNFYHVTRLDEAACEETLLKKIYPTAIRTDSNLVPSGIHTYNVNERYEIIDLKEYKIDIWFYIMRPIWFVWRRIKKICGR